MGAVGATGATATARHGPSCQASSHGGHGDALEAAHWSDMVWSAGVLRTENRRFRRWQEAGVWMEGAPAHPAGAGPA